MRKALLLIAFLVLGATPVTPQTGTGNPCEPWQIRYARYENVGCPYIQMDTTWFIDFPNMMIEVPHEISHGQCANSRNCNSRNYNEVKVYPVNYVTVHWTNLSVTIISSWVNGTATTTSGVCPANSLIRTYVEVIEGAGPMQYGKIITKPCG